jgi:hypothetical protein
MTLQRTAGNAAAERALQRAITWAPRAKQVYARSAGHLVAELATEFPHVQRETIAGLVAGIEQLGPDWSPYQAYLAIKQRLKRDFSAPSEPVHLDGTNITKQEAEWYFIRDYKTFAEVILDDEHVFKFHNTPDDDHAEDNMMRDLDKFISKEGWDRDFTGAHTIQLTINNSPCKRCARRLYEWNNRDIFVEFTVTFANMYGNDGDFKKATTLLRSGGVVMNLMHVTRDLLPLVAKENEISKRLRAAREAKDEDSARAWAIWQQENPALGQDMSSK